MREAGAACLREFTEQAAALGVASVEARLVEDVADYALLLQSRYADLVVLSQGSGADTLPGAAVVGWDGGMCALRAIAAALPLLQAADTVKLALINPDQLLELHGEDPGADMAVYLARHGVNVDVVVERTHATVGDALMALASDCHAGLMVSGVYGHSRFRELVLGGVTRELLERAPVPVLLAH
jgi:nucleotide-binding universal stress UspA family protein